MNILVAGGAGFIGSNFCRFLLKGDHKVFVCDNLITGRLENLNGVDVEFIEKNVENLKSSDFDHLDRIYDFACPASPKDFHPLAMEILSSSTRGCYNLLQLARHFDARYLLASSSEVYGMAEVHPQTEEYLGRVNCYGERSCYNEGKRIAETYTYTFQNKFSVETRVARIFNTYGPYMRENDGRVIPNFLHQARNSKPLTVVGDGSQTRSFMYVTDIAVALYKLMESDYSHPINIGNPEETSIFKLAEKINTLIGNENSMEFLPGREDETQLRKPDISKAREILNWEPKISLDVGLRQLVASLAPNN